MVDIRCALRDEHSILYMFIEFTSRPSKRFHTLEIIQETTKVIYAEYASYTFLFTLLV